MRTWKFFKRIFTSERYKKPDTFVAKTKTDGISTLEGGGVLFVNFLMVFYGVLLLMKLWSRSNIQISQNIVKTDLRTDYGNTTVIAEDGIELKFSLTSIQEKVGNYSWEEALDIFDIVFGQIKWLKSKNGTFEAEHSFLSATPGSEDLQIIGEENMEKSLCFKIENIEFLGLFDLSSNHQALYFNLNVCLNNDSDIGTDFNDVAHTILHTGVEIFLKSKYVDLNDVGNPIKEYVTSIDYSRLNPEMKIMARAFIGIVKVWIY